MKIELDSSEIQVLGDLLANEHDRQKNLLPKLTTQLFITHTWERIRKIENIARKLCYDDELASKLVKQDLQTIFGE